MTDQKKTQVLVTGAGGFVGSHLTRLLKKEGGWVRGVDLKRPEHSETAADEFLILDLRERGNCRQALDHPEGFDEVYHLAADRGGIGYMEPFECEMMQNNALINIYMVTEAVKLKKLPRFFFSSSVCVYQDMEPGSPPIGEEEVYPAFPDNEYGWEKLYAERTILAYRRRYHLPVRIGRFQTTFGPEANWEGGREKAADALCRKAALAEDGGELEVWGDGTAVRSFNFIEDLLSGIQALMKSDINQPANISNDEYVTVAELAQTVIDVSGKNLTIKYVPGPVGVKARNFSNQLIYTTGWRPGYTLRQGIEIHYPWVAAQVAKKYGRR